MNQPKIERLLRLMQMLATNINYRVEDIANALDISSRSVYRYLDTFEAVGFVVHRTFPVQLCIENPLLKDVSQLVYFSREEAYLVHQLIEAIDDSNLVKQNLRRKLASACNYQGIVDSIINKENASNIHYILEAIEKKKQVIFSNYSSAHGENITNRLVEPFLFTSNYIQVWCYEPETGHNKMFRISRIANVVILDTNWESESSHREGLMDVFRMSSYDSKSFSIKLEMNVRAYNLLIEEYPLANKYTYQVDCHTWILETNVSDYAGVGRFVAGLAADIRIIQPISLQEYVKDYARKYILGDES
jgi:predicted DNA-binding transcriptional regulator YafY